VKRSRPALELLRSPLVYFLAQVRFSQVLKLGDYLPEVQDRLRKEGFPGFRRSQMAQVTFQSGTPSFASVEQYEFQNADTTEGIILGPESITYHTTRYGMYEEFEPRFRRAIEHVHDVVGLSLLERCGLRYVDLIQTRAGETLADYLRPETLGLDLAKVGVQNATSNYLFQGTTEIGRLNIRISKTIGEAQPLPLDLSPMMLAMDKKIGNGELAAILDFDHFSERRTDFTVETAIEQLGELHDAITRAFAQAVTAKAFQLWESRERK
jgi:uncharacterized protein (TIGR04255 family)